MIRATKCGLDYILECIRNAKTNEHWAYLTPETKTALEARGFRIESHDPHRLSKITWPRF